MDHFSLVWLEYSGPALKVVHFDLVWSFWSVRPKCPFQFDKIVDTPVPLFCILLTRTITKHTVAWVGYVQLECTIRLGTWNFRNFKLEFLLIGKCLWSTVNSVLTSTPIRWPPYSLSLTLYKTNTPLNTGPKVVCVRNSWLYVVYEAMFWCFWSRLGVEHLKSLGLHQHYNDSEALHDFPKATCKWL